MNESRIGSNPFLRAAEELRTTGRVERKVIESPSGAERPVTRRGPRALLNYIPNDSELSRMIDGALSALSKGLRWDRGSILNVLV